MKFLLRSLAGETLPLAMRLKDEGNSVRLAIKDSEYQAVGDGFIDKTSLVAGIEWADVVIFDSSLQGMAAEAEKARFQTSIMGTGKLAGMLEHDRAFAIEAARQAGLKVPEGYEEFEGKNAWRAAAAFLETLPDDADWVWKPNGNGPCSTYVAEGTQELKEMLPYWEALWADHDEPVSFILTPKIEGEEISTEAWFNGSEFFLPNHTIERNKFFEGDHGEKTGCAGNVVWLASMEAPLYQELLAPLQPILAGQFWGPIDVNAIIEKDSNQPIFLEFSPRFGLDAIFAFMELLDSELGALLAGMALGDRPYTKFKSDFGGAVRVHIPPYPLEANDQDQLRAVGLPIFGWDGRFSRHYSGIEVMRNADGDPVSSGPDGYVMVVSGTGGTPQASMEAAYQRVEKLRIPTSRWRTDLAGVEAELYRKLKATGWLDARKQQGGFAEILRRAGVR